MATRTIWLATVGENPTATNLNKGAKGWRGYVQSTTGQGPLSSETDVSGMSLTFAVDADRYMEADGEIQVTGSTDAVYSRLFMYRTATVFGRSQMQMGTSQQTQHVWAVVEDLAAGSYTFKLAVVPVVTADTLTTSPGTGLENRFLIKDIGSDA